MYRKRGIVTLVFGLLALVLPFMAQAQSDLSSVSGTITDPSGALVAGASVTLTSELTGAVHMTQSNKNGYYTIPGLAPGKYTITVEGKGFEKLVVTGNNLDPSIPTTANEKLVVGTTQTVDVTANQATLTADSATLGRVITGEQVDNLPLDGRNPIYVALTKAGVTSGPTSPTTANSAGAGSNVSTFNFSTGLGAIQINGGRERDNLITYDGGVAVRVRASGDSVGVVDAEAVQEVQVLATDYPAEYGRSTGGQIRVITKGGSSQFHGSLYEYLQNPDLNANTWVRNHNTNNTSPTYPGILKTNFVAPFTYNQFGGSIGGPLWIPHVIPKGKIFFFESENFTVYPTTPTAPVTVPNPAFRNGDFSSLITGNPATTKYLRNTALGLPCNQQTGLGGGCFGNENGGPSTNIIPAQYLSHNGVGLLSIFPTPTPNFMVGTNNLLQIAKYPAHQEIDTGNLDIVPNEKNYIRFRLTHFFYHEDNPFSAAYDTVPRLYNRPNEVGSLDWVKTFSDKMTNEVLVTASHDAARLSIDTSGQAYNGQGPAYSRTSYGISYPFLFPGTKDLPNKIPTVAFGSSTQITSMDGSAYPSHSQGEIFDFADTFTRVIGDHIVRAGALYERSGENDRDQIAFSPTTTGQTNNQNGEFIFASSPVFPSGPNTGSAEFGTGYDLADAATGLYYTYAEVGARDETPYRGNMYEFFAQDSWKITPKLHLEYGVRYSSIHPYYSEYNNAGSFDPAFYNPATAEQVSLSTGNPVAGSGDPLDGTVLWGNGFTSNAASHVAAAQTSAYNSLFHNLPRGYIHVQKYLSQPRLGIAYQLNNKTVLRTGFGRYVNRQGVSDFVFAGGIPPLQQVASLSFGSVDNPGAGANGSYPTLSGDIDQNSPQPEAYIWNATVERQVGFGTTVEVSYVGRHALHQQYAANINQLQPGTVTAATEVQANALRPYKGYSAINLVKQGDTAFYQGLQVDATRRFQHGLSFGLAYTYASSRDCDSFQKTVIPNTFDPKSICGPADYDIRQVLAMNSIYAIPFKSGNQILEETLGGWQLTQAYQFQTGAPLSVYSGTDFAGVGPGSGNQLYNLVAGASLTGDGGFSAGHSWFNKAAFVAPTAGTFAPGNLRNILRAPGQAYFNAALLKKFPIVEGQILSFRVDAFDFPNHPNWNAPDTNFTSATFGQVTQKNGNRSLQGSLRYSF
jgi:hypothetical protein